MFVIAVRFTACTAGAVTTGAETAMPVHAVRPELCSACRKAAGVIPVMLVASPEAVFALAVVMLKSTATPAPSRRRRDESATLSTLTADVLTLSSVAMPAMKPLCAALSKEALV